MYNDPKEVPMKKSPAAAKRLSSQDVVEFLLKELQSWGIFLYYSAATGSKYLKFPHWALGTIQVRDHDGLKAHRSSTTPRYAYKWTVRMEADPQKTFGLYSPDELDRLVLDFCGNADAKGVLPGDNQSWYDFKGIPVPKRMAKAFKRAGVKV